MRVLSGIQPSGELHIGNYFGALKNFVNLQKKYEGFFMVADLHALTVSRPAKELRENILHVMRMFLAIGLNPKKSVLFLQSQVPQHTELGWILETLAPLGELERMTQFKEKSKEHAQNINAGLLTYPVLQAADILIYKTDAVPVGEDQIQHVELTRTLARKFNNTYGKVFKEPKVLLEKNAARILSLQDPAKKMSKSLGTEHALLLLEGDQSLRAKIKRAVTDSEGTVMFDPERRPGIANLITIYTLATGKSIKEVESRFKGQGYAKFKDELAEALVAHLRPIQEKYRKTSGAEAEKIFMSGCIRARKEAEKLMKPVRKTVGLV